MNRLTDWIKKTIKHQESDDPEEITGWQPIETAPKDGTVIDICGHWEDKKMVRFADVYWGIESVWNHNDQMPHTWRTEFAPLNRRFTPTHWMPIPKLPIYVSPNSREGLKAEANRWVEDIRREHDESK